MRIPDAFDSPVQIDPLITKQILEYTYIRICISKMYEQIDDQILLNLYYIIDRLCLKNIEYILLRLWELETALIFNSCLN